MKSLKKSLNSQGLFITFEGGEGSGKTSLIPLVTRELQGRGLSVLATRNPGGFPLGEKIRAMLQHQVDHPVGPRCELLLFLADRAQHVEEVILPALERGEIVLCDRFNDSSLTYQGVARHLDRAFLKKLCAFAAHDLVPDLTLLLDIDPVIGFERMRKRGRRADRLEREEPSFHQMVRKGYLDLAKEEPERIRVIDARQSQEKVFEQALREIDASLTTKTA